MDSVGAIIHYALVAVDHLPTIGDVGQFLPNGCVAHRRYRIRPYNSSIPGTLVALNHVGALFYTAHVAIDRVSHSLIPSLNSCLFIWLISTKAL